MVSFLSHHTSLPSPPLTIVTSALRDGSGEWQRMTQGQPATTDYSSPRRGDPARTPGKKERQRRARNEATFGTPIDDMLTTEFDFESNLALFDKQVSTATLKEAWELVKCLSVQLTHFTLVTLIMV